MFPSGIALAITARYATRLVVSPQPLGFEIGAPTRPTVTAAINASDQADIAPVT